MVHSPFSWWKICKKEQMKLIFRQYPKHTDKRLGKLTELGVKRERQRGQRAEPRPGFMVGSYSRFARLSFSSYTCLVPISLSLSLSIADHLLLFPLWENLTPFTESTQLFNNGPYGLSYLGPTSFIVSNPTFVTGALVVVRLEAAKEGLC